VLPHMFGTNSHGRLHYRALESLRVGCVLVLLLHGMGYVSPLWAWVCLALSWVAFSELDPRGIQLTSIDYAVIGLWLFEVASIPLSSFPGNGWVYVEQLTIAIALYFCISRFRSPLGLSLVALFACGLTLALVVPDAMHFMDRYSEWTQLTFGSIADVKKSITMVGSRPAGAHYTVYLFFLFLGLAAMGGRHRIPVWARCVGAVTLGAGLAGILLSLSRGLYVAAIAAACCAYGTTSLRLPSRSRFGWRALTITAVLALLGVGLFFRFAPQRSFAGPSTANSESASRSIEGRFFLWRQVLHAGRSRPLLGSGAHTFVLYGAEGITQDGGEGVDRAFSFPVQLFFERGLMGVLIYTALFVVVFRTAVMNMRRSSVQHGRWSCLSWAAAAGLAGLLVRDLSYTTLFDDKPVTTGAFVLIGLIALEESKRTTRDSQPAWPAVSWKLGILGVVVAVGMIVGAHRVRRAAADSYSAEAAQADSAHDDRAALQHSLRALAILPHPYLQAQAGLFSARSAGIALKDRGRPALLATSQDDLRQLADAESFYRSSLDAFPSEASWQHNLGWLLWLRGDRNSALQRIRQAIELEPGTAVYRQSLILMLIDQSAFDSARDELVTLLTLAPEVVDSRWWESIALEQESTVRSALHLAIDTLANRSAANPIQLAREARLYLEAGDLSAAELLLKESLRELPGMSGAWRNYALILARRGQWDQAAESLERAVFLDPWDGAGYYALSRVVLHIGAEDGQDGQQMRRVSFMFQTKADGVQAASSRSLESMRAYRKFQIEAPVKDDLVVDGLLEFCRPDMAREYDKLMQRPVS